MQPIDRAELLRRLEIAHRMEDELLNAISGGARLIAPSELLTRIYALGDLYLRVVIAFAIVAFAARANESPMGDSQNFDGTQGINDGETNDPGGSATQ